MKTGCLIPGTFCKLFINLCFHLTGFVVVPMLYPRKIRTCETSVKPFTYQSFGMPRFEPNLIYAFISMIYCGLFFTGHRLVHI